MDISTPPPPPDYHPLLFISVLVGPGTSKPDTHGLIYPAAPQSRNLLSTGRWNVAVSAEHRAFKGVDGGAEASTFTQLIPHQWACLLVSEWA